MAKGYWRWQCGCIGHFEGKCERVVKTCSHHPQRNYGKPIAHRYEPRDNGAKRIPVKLVPPPQAVGTGA